MKSLLFLTVALIVFSSVAACAWTEYYDGTPCPRSWIPGGGQQRRSSSVAAVPSTVRPALGTTKLESGPTAPASPRWWSGRGSGSTRWRQRPVADPDVGRRLAAIDVPRIGIMVTAVWPGGLSPVAQAPAPTTPYYSRALGRSTHAWHTAYLLMRAGRAWQASIDGTVYPARWRRTTWRSRGLCLVRRGQLLANTRAIDTSSTGSRTATRQHGCSGTGKPACSWGWLVGLFGAIRRRR